MSLNTKHHMSFSNNMSLNTKHHMSNMTVELIIKLHEEKKSLRQTAKIVGKTHSLVQIIV